MTMNLTKRFDDSVHASVQELITDDVKNVARIKKVAHEATADCAPNVITTF